MLDGVCSPLLFSFVDAQLRQGPPNRCRACLHRAGDDFARGLARDHLPGASPRCRNEVRMVARSLILISLLGQSAASSWIRAATYTCIPFQECVVCLVISWCFCLSTAKSASGAVRFQSSEPLPRLPGLVSFAHPRTPPPSVLSTAVLHCIALRLSSA